eukprot:TRINITY_DN136_c0_g6_i1.p1 TRINITY_DN136_c0_g6~~TRINITY_DN136_c0_g6_i1.p1  ORF type:complete len:324 (-),score=60.57 TRINITY_DN136_c0_g6_i1:105-1076(-)
MEPATKRRRIECETTALSFTEGLCWETALFPDDDDFMYIRKYSISTDDAGICDAEIEDFFKECEEFDAVKPRVQTHVIRKPLVNQTSLPNTNTTALLSGPSCNLNRKISSNTVQLNKLIPPPTPVASYVPYPVSATPRAPPSPPKKPTVQVPSRSGSSGSIHPYGYDMNGNLVSTIPHGMFPQHVMLPAHMVMWNNPNTTLASLPSQSFSATQQPLPKPAAQNLTTPNPGSPSRKGSLPGSPTRRGHVPASLNGISANGKPVHSKQNLNVKKIESKREQITAPFLKRKRNNLTSKPIISATQKNVSNNSSAVHRYPQPIVMLT